jgi:hypothetical protein
MKKRGFITISVVLLVCITALVAIGVNIIYADRTDGKFEQGVVNRVNFTLSPTSASYTTGTDEYVFEATLTAQKNEAEFYAILHSLTVSGMEYSHIVLTPLLQYDVAADFNDLKMVSIVNDKNTYVPAKYGWTVQIFFDQNSVIENPTVDITYTSGIKETAADKRILSIPIEIDINA